MASSIDLKALAESISDGIIRGNAGVVTGFTTEAERRHRLAEAMQVTTDKVHQLDNEMVLVKGMLVALIGKDADGSSGLVPRMDSDMKSLKTDVVSIKGDMANIKDDVSLIVADLKVIKAAQANQTSWTDGWRGVAFAVIFGGAAVTFIGSCVMALMWLYQHGMPAVGQHANVF